MKHYYPAYNQILMLVVLSIPPLAVANTDRQQDTKPIDDFNDIVIFDKRSSEVVIPAEKYKERAKWSFEKGQHGGELYGVQLSLDEVVPVHNPTLWPARANVIVASPSSNSACSGTLIDSMHVLTAAHCFYTDSGGWNYDDQIVSPGTFEYGTARVTGVLTFKGWTKYGWSDHDVAVAQLDRPIGALTGFYGYGTASCWDLTHGDYETYSFPQLGPYGGQMVHTDGDADWCPTFYKVQANIDGWQGMSGSSLSNKSAIPVARAVAVTKYNLWPEGIRYARVTNDKYSAMHDLIHGHRSQAADLIPVGLKVNDGNLIVDIKPELGETLKLSEIFIHNYASVSFSGNVDVQIKLSDNQNITANDPTIWSHSGYYDIDAMGVASVPPFNVDLPDEYTSGKYYLGVWLDIDDADTSNNSGSNTVFNELVTVMVHDLYTDLSVSEINVAPGKYSDFDTPGINFTVENKGQLPSGTWTGDLFLSSQPFFEEGEAIFVGTGSAGSIAPGENAFFFDNISLKNVPSGDYWLSVVVHTEEDELTEFNNSKTSTTAITVDAISAFKGSPPNLRVDYVGLAQGAYSQADNLPVAFSVTNTGTQSGVWQSVFYAVNTSGDVVTLANGSSGSILAGGNVSSTVQLPLDGLSGGSWWIVMNVMTGDETYTGDNNAQSPTQFTIEYGLKL